MITFLIPLKSGQHVNSATAFRYLLRTTLAACWAVPDAQVLVVCNASTPIVSVPDAQAHRTKFLTIEETGLPYGDSDKEVKLFAGCRSWLAQSQWHDHLMPLDCDDLVSRSINKAALSGQSTVLMRGYLKIWDRAYLQDAFYWRNGSSHILARDFVEKATAKGLHKRFLFHHDFDYEADGFAKEFRPLILQRICHGENVHYRVEEMRLKKLLKYLFFSVPTDQSEFGKSVEHSATEYSVYPLPDVSENCS